MRWHCPPDTGFEIRALAVWGRARYLSVTEAPHNTNFHTWMGKKQFCFFQTAGTGNRTPDSGVKGSGANHYPRAPAQKHRQLLVHWNRTSKSRIMAQKTDSFSIITKVIWPPEVSIPIHPHCPPLPVIYDPHTWRMISVGHVPTIWSVLNPTEN